VNLDAVFEAAPYRPGPDGRFHPHQEASGFATHGVATLDQIRRRVLEVMAGYRRPWWVAGGWALDLLLGAKTRPHADLEISMLAADQLALFRHLHGWDLRLAAPGQSLPPWDGGRIQPPFHQIWARRGPGRPSTAEEFAADLTMLGFLLEQSRANRWVYRRHHGVSRPLHQVGVRAAGGVRVVPPEIALLFKAKAPRFKDQRDFDRVLPHLDRAARSWLASAPGAGPAVMIVHGVSRGSGRGVSPPGPTAMSWLAGEPCLMSPRWTAPSSLPSGVVTIAVCSPRRQRSANSALTAAIWHNHKTGQPVLRSLIAYDHS
jgi:hypothetical protein